MTATFIELLLKLSRFKDNRLYEVMKGFDFTKVLLMTLLKLS